MAARIVIARAPDFKGGDVARECDAGSPGSAELRPTCAETSLSAYGVYPGGISALVPLMAMVARV
jgi:hypothetical protein